MKFISVRSTLIFIVCAGIAISSPAQSGAALPLPPDSVRGEGCEPDSDSAPPDARQGDLFGAKPFDRRDGRQIYVSLLVLVVPLLPGEPASVAQPERRGAEFRPFAAPVAGLRHRRDALSGELQPAKHTGTRHPAEYHPDGRHPQALLVAQPPRPVRPQGV